MKILGRWSGCAGTPDGVQATIDRRRRLRWAVWNGATPNIAAGPSAMSNDRLLGGPPRGAREGRPAERAWEALPPAPAGAVTIWRGADGRGGMRPLASTRRPDLLGAAW